MKPATTSPERLRLPAVDALDLDVSGMTCASCAARIERKLNKLDGVAASVNYATEQARVDVGASGLSVDDVIATIESVGYGARVHTAGGAADDTLVRLRRRLIVAIALGLPVLLLSMIPALQFDGWQWVALALATPVATWAAWPFHRAMVLNLRHRQATMDTLISIGVIAAYGWSLWALLFTDAGKVFSSSREFNFQDLEKSYGIGFRFNTAKSVFLRIDTAYGNEGTRLFVKFGHVF
jgi:Cu+-exporting ATPase